MRQYYNSEKIGRNWKLVIGFVVIVLMLPMGLVKSAQATPPATEAEMTLQHDMIKQDIADVKALVEALEVGAPCGAGTEGQRFVVSEDGKEVCDNTTGLYWEQSPTTNTFNHANALTHCSTLDLGNGQTYSLPEIKKLISLVDYSQFDPALPLGHPFSNILSPSTSFNYWSATPSSINSAWAVTFNRGQVLHPGTANNNQAWCAR